MKNWWWKVMTFQNQNCATLDVTFLRRNEEEVGLRYLIRDIGLPGYKRLPSEALKIQDNPDKDYYYDLSSYDRHPFFTGKNNYLDFEAVNISDRSFFVMTYPTWDYMPEYSELAPITQLLTNLLQMPGLYVAEWKLTTGYFEDYPQYQQIAAEGDHESLIEYLNL